jgi:hypothetical protein
MLYSQKYLLELISFPGSVNPMAIGQLEELGTLKKFRMLSSGMLRCVPLVRSYVSEELSASIIRVT